MSTLEKKLIVAPEVCLSRKCGLRGEYFRETLRREKLEKQLERVTAENQKYKRAVTVLLSSIGDLLKPDHAALNLLRERLFPIPEVTGLHYFVSDGVINLWIVTREENFEIEMRIADSLVELFSIFRTLRFDFVIIPRYDLSLEEILPSESVRLFSK